MSSSSSSSSAAWSDEEKEKKKISTESKAEQSSTPLIRPRHGEKLSFQAPPGYLPSPHSQELLSVYNQDSLKESSKKQLWIVKIPEEVPPSALDGLVIQVPSTSTSTLAQIQIQEVIKGSSHRSRKKSYSLRSQNSSLDSRDSGHTSTQLIAMAGGYLNEEQYGDHQAMREAESLQIMLPHSHSQQGRYVFAPSLSKQYFRLVLDDIEPNSSTDQPVIGPKRKREQPIGKLKGSFLPAGARSEEDQSDPVFTASPLKVKKTKEVISPVKDSKKDKKKRKSQ